MTAGAAGEPKQVLAEPERDPGVPGLADLERRARAALTRLVEPRDEDVAAALASGGAAGVVERIRARLPGDGLADRYARRLGSLDIDGQLAKAHEVGARLLCPGDDEWPEALGILERLTPYALWVRGDGHLTELTERSVAVVGSRASTRYGDHVAAELAGGLAERGWTVVSGAAYGIDGAAHRGALAAGGPTVAVVANGVDVCYPRGHDSLLGRILASGGLVVSELAPGTPPNRKRFLDRNRLIAAMTRGTVVVEAALRSGARNTATWAATLGRPLGAVPGPVTSAMSAGCHEEMRLHGAAVITDAADVVDLVGAFGVDATELRRGPDRPFDLLDADSQAVYDALPLRRPCDPSALVASTGRALPVVLRALGILVAQGLAEGAAGRWRKAG